MSDHPTQTDSDLTPAPSAPPSPEDHTSAPADEPALDPPTSEHNFHDLPDLGPYGREWVEKYMHLDRRFEDHSPSDPLSPTLFNGWEEFDFCQAVLSYGEKDYGMTVAEVVMWWERGISELEKKDSVCLRDVRDRASPLRPSRNPILTAVRLLQQRAQEEAGELAGTPPPPFKEYKISYNDDGEYIGHARESGSPCSSDPRSPVAGAMDPTPSLLSAAQEAGIAPTVIDPPPPFAPLPVESPVFALPSRRNTIWIPSINDFYGFAPFGQTLTSAGLTVSRPFPTLPRIIIPTSSRPPPTFPYRPRPASHDMLQRRMTDPGARPSPAFYEPRLPVIAPLQQADPSAVQQEATAVPTPLMPAGDAQSDAYTEEVTVASLQIQLQAQRREMEQMKRIILGQAGALQESGVEMAEMRGRLHLLEVKSAMEMDSLTWNNLFHAPNL